VENCFFLKGWQTCTFFFQFLSDTSADWQCHGTVGTVGSSPFNFSERPSLVQRPGRDPLVRECCRPQHNQATDRCAAATWPSESFTTSWQHAGQRPALTRNIPAPLGPTQWSRRRRPSGCQPRVWRWRLCPGQPAQRPRRWPWRRTPPQRPRR
jgi:hypothetical protein